ncbi:MAG TPA: Zn-dependent protease with chaperone function [Cyanobacteria bacterium UBA11162]|nr:Zn-dependent protease with chaperone function [Cyanobacteria bacterium UBA11162]
MHLIMILVALGLAWFLRLSYRESVQGWTERFCQAMILFVFPPLLLLMTALALVCMGSSGQMLGIGAGWFSYSIAVGFLGWIGGICLKLAIEGWRFVRKVRTYPQLEVGGRQSRLLDAPVLFCANVGFWQPELVISQGLLKTLDSAHLDAVIAHEQAHYYYRDTFWFFWLGWLRSITAWLPNTDALWQELLVLRELRADCWATQYVDPLLLAESLLWVVSHPMMQSENFCAALYCVAPQTRLEERIEALLAEPDCLYYPSWKSWTWLLLAFLPLAAIPFHS